SPEHTFHYVWRELSLARDATPLEYLPCQLGRTGPLLRIPVAARLQDLREISGFLEPGIEQLGGNSICNCGVRPEIRTQSVRPTSDSWSSCHLSVFRLERLTLDVVN